MHQCRTCLAGHAGHACALAGVPRTAGHLTSLSCCVLPQEKVRDWTQRFGALGVTCRELTGGQGAGICSPAWGVGAA